MDLIELVFHIAPDHGSGTLEAAILLVAFAVPSTFLILRITRRRGVLALLRRKAGRG